MADVLRPPYIVRITVRSATAAQTQGPANRLALTSVAVASPFYQTDWPNPQPRLYPVALRTFTNPFPINLYGKDQFFAAPGQAPRYDYPNPRIAVRLNVGFTLNILPLLYGQDVFFGPPGMGPDYDFPNPVRKPRQPLGLTQNALALTSAAPVAAPFPAQDFPNPVRRRTAQPDGLGRSFDPAPPFAPLDFANPSRRRVAQPETAGRTLDPQAPFQGAAFDNPRRASRPPVDLSSPNLVLFATFPVPFHQADWPNPSRRFFHFGVPWSTLLAPSEIPAPVIPDFWTPVTPGAGSWSAVAANSETWTPVAQTPKTWTPT